MEHFRSVYENEEKLNSVKVLPIQIRLKVIAISMENLDKIRSPVGICEGFDLKEFDQVILVRVSKFKTLKLIFF